MVKENRVRHDKNVRTADAGTEAGMTAFFFTKFFRTNGAKKRVNIIGRGLSLCLENPRDGGAWWAAISGVAQSRTRLK